MMRSKENVYFVRRGFFGMMLMLSGVTSGLYFVEVFADEGWLGKLVAALVGVFVLDGALVSWLQIFLKGCDNNRERTLAMYGAIIGGVGSTVASFAYLFTTADAFVLSADFDTYTTVTLAMVIVGHIILVSLFQYYGTQARIDDTLSDVLAQGQDLMLTMTRERFENKVKTLAERNARLLVRRLETQFALSHLKEAPQANEPAIVQLAQENGHVTAPKEPSGER